jgi:ubiquitin-conjugating enzyme E2 S
LLIDPNPTSALNEDAGKLLLEDYPAYCSHAQLYTEVHALKPKTVASANLKKTLKSSGNSREDLKRIANVGNSVPLASSQAQNTEVSDSAVPKPRLLLIGIGVKRLEEDENAENRPSKRTQGNFSASKAALRRL